MTHWFINPDTKFLALPARSKTARKFITNVSHYPPAQAAYAEADVQKTINRAIATGPETEILIKKLLESTEPLKHFRRCQGIMSLGWNYSNLLLEAACQEANRFNNTNAKYLENVIKMRKGVIENNEEQVKSRAYNPHLRGVNNIH